MYNYTCSSGLTPASEELKKLHEESGDADDDDDDAEDSDEFYEAVDGEVTATKDAPDPNGELGLD